MKYAIIAAGEGSRLAAEGVSQPKPLVRVGGEALIDRLIRIFIANDADEVVVVCNDRCPEVAQHLEALKPIVSCPLTVVVKTTPSSMHSFFEISRYLEDEPFILTTVDTVFREDEFARYVDVFRHSACDGLMGVTSYIDDEKPLYVETTADMDITAFNDVPLGGTAGGFISAGIYGLRPNSLLTLRACIGRHESRMRNFQRALLADGLRLKSWPFTNVFDIDHASDIEKAEKYLHE